MKTKKARTAILLSYETILKLKAVKRESGGTNIHEAGIEFSGVSCHLLSKSDLAFY